MLHHVMDVAKKAGAKRTVIVAGYRSNLVTGAAKTFSSEAEIVVQQEQLGTGHAVKPVSYTHLTLPTILLV